jgi:hypothetical protein
MTNRMGTGMQQCDHVTMTEGKAALATGLGRALLHPAVRFFLIIIFFFYSINKFLLYRNHDRTVNDKGPTSTTRAHTTNNDDGIWDGNPITGPDYTTKGTTGWEASCLPVLEVIIFFFVSIF